MKKLFVVLTTALVITFLLTACATPGIPGSSQSQPTQSAAQPTVSATVSEAAPASEAASSAEKKSYKIGFCPMDLSNPFFAQMKDGAQEWADENGVELVTVDGKSDAQQQVTAVENFISQGCDAIALVPVDAESLKGIVNEAIGKGIPVVTHTTKIEGATAYVSVDETEMGTCIGETAGQWIADNLGGKCKYAILNQPTLPQIIRREQGIQAGIEKYAPNAELVATVAAWLPDMGMEAAENILQAHPDVQVIVGINDSGALGAYESVVAQGVDTSKFFIGGVDGSQEAMKKIAEGGAYRGTVDIQPTYTGGLLLDYCIKAINGEELPADTWIPVKAVTIDNVQEYLS